jgi:hypothetical protein
VGFWTFLVGFYTFDGFWACIFGGKFVIDILHKIYSSRFFHFLAKKTGKREKRENKSGKGKRET